ncbi:MAG: transposase, partial [Trichodesmium sp. St7_bin2_1]|nr:transposase [Trichodesmium sp. St7_bin2_1]MDE5112672.1 transposase [Trichodesmium sp. St7_bin2_1]
PHKTSLWSPSYFVASVGGAPLQTLKQYIQNQKSP